MAIEVAKLNAEVQNMEKKCKVEGKYQPQGRQKLKASFYI